MIHEAGMIFTKKHWKAMGGFCKNSEGEGVKMIDGMNPKTIGLLECHKVIICICHNNNTICKDRFYENDNLKGGVEQLSLYDKQLILNSIT